MLRLPEDAQLLICALLAAPDLARMARVSRRFRTVARNDQLWDKFLPLQLRTPPTLATAQSAPPLYLQYAYCLTKGDFFPLHIGDALPTDGGKVTRPPLTFQCRSPDGPRSEVHPTICLYNKALVHLGANDMGNSLEMLFTGPSDESSRVFVPPLDEQKPGGHFGFHTGTRPGFRNMLPVEDAEQHTMLSNSAATAVDSVNDLAAVQTLAARLNCEHQARLPPSAAAGASAQDLLSSLFPSGDYVVACYTCVPAHFQPPEPNRDDLRRNTYYYDSLLQQCETQSCLYRSWCGAPPAEAGHNATAPEPNRKVLYPGDVSASVQHYCDGSKLYLLWEEESEPSFSSGAKDETSCDYSKRPPDSLPRPSQHLETTVLFVRCHERPLDIARVSHYAALLRQGHLPTVLCVTVCDPRPVYFMYRWWMKDSHLGGLFLQTNYVLDGHHKMAAAAETGLPVRIVSFCVTGTSIATLSLTSYPTREVLGALTAARCEAHPPYTVPRAVNGLLDTFGPPFFARMFMPPSTPYSLVHRAIMRVLHARSNTDEKSTDMDITVDGMRFSDFEGTAAQRTTPANRAFVELVFNSKDDLLTLEARSLEMCSSESLRLCVYIPRHASASSC
eukprot:gnl/Spiro4/26001_TR12950_c1_g1_i1.p1 gnl/Spiro4/26001_TR12950_c1_g1~~gnl/Spiro4/26001_TR12950_c1_g1_i1.p1  ORF type:complete len:625 (-),score=119.02 gnl/Spiro4/26001_TR12950_c1_g1_i1:67-1914(-)